MFEEGVARHAMRIVSLELSPWNWNGYAQQPGWKVCRLPSYWTYEAIQRVCSNQDYLGGGWVPGVFLA
jgi:hypothetical protein